MSEYAQAAIPEYWIIDPAIQSITVYALTDGVYQQIGTPAIAQSRVLGGFELSAAELFATAAKKA
jgi:Uma2 family endonuclease